MSNLNTQTVFRWQQSGLSYIEVLVASVILVLSIGPASLAIQTSADGASANRSLVQQKYRMLAKMEEVLSQPVSVLDAEAAATGGATASSWSDNAGVADRLLVYLNPYDADNADGDDDTATGTDNNIVLVRVKLENSTLTIASLAAE